MGQSTYPGNRTFTDGGGAQSASMAAAAEHVRQAATVEAEDMSEKLGAAGAEIEKALRASLEAQPAATLAVFAAVGFVLGAIWKR